MSYHILLIGSHCVFSLDRFPVFFSAYIPTVNSPLFVHRLRCNAFIVKRKWPHPRIHFPQEEEGRPSHWHTRSRQLFTISLPKSSLCLLTSCRLEHLRVVSGTDQSVGKNSLKA